MMATPHALVGMAIGTAISNPYVAIPVAFLAHYVGDLVPHWDFFDHFPSKEEMKTLRGQAIFYEIFLGILVGSAITAYAFFIKQDFNLALNIFLCGIAGVTPDAMYAPVVFMKTKNKILVGNHKLQEKLHVHAGPIWGNLSQIMVALAAFLVILGSLR